MRWRRSRGRPPRLSPPRGAIARGNIDTPLRGLKKLGQYLGEHTGQMLGAWGATLAAIERTPDDLEHDDRARVARDREGARCTIPYRHSHALLAIQSWVAECTDCRRCRPLASTWSTSRWRGLQRRSGAAGRGRRA